MNGAKNKCFYCGSTSGLHELSYRNQFTGERRTRHICKECAIERGLVN